MLQCFQFAIEFCIGGNFVAQFFISGVEFIVCLAVLDFQLVVLLLRYSEALEMRFFKSCKLLLKLCILLSR